MLCYAKFIIKNATVGCFNWTGKHFNTHFDDWTHDEIVELAAEAGVSPSFPIPTFWPLIL
jgi:hypothetical protein